MEKRGTRSLAIVLAGGSGSRMQASTKKQFMQVNGRPLLWYSLHMFEKSPEIDDIVLAVSAQDLDYARHEIVEPGGFRKVRRIVPGGAERWNSVYNALRAVQEGCGFTEMAAKSFSDPAVQEGSAAGSLAGKQRSAYDIVLIHDSARPMLTEELIRVAAEGAARFEACVAGVPVKDTIKVLDSEQYVKSTPDRSTLWSMQTPQAFSFPLIWRAYSRLQQLHAQGGLDIPITDDAMVVEHFAKHPVKILMGDYRNIKVTTPEDLPLAELYLK